MKKEDIMAGSQNFEKWLNLINSKEINPDLSEYPASTSVFIFNTPILEGLITTDYNTFYGELIRSDRLKGKTKEQYEYLENKYIGEKRVFTLYDLHYALYDELTFLELI